MQHNQKVYNIQYTIYNIQYTIYNQKQYTVHPGNNYCVSYNSKKDIKLLKGSMDRQNTSDNAQK